MSKQIGFQAEQCGRFLLSIQVSFCLPDMHEIGENEGFLGVESTSNDILGVLSRELDALFQLEVGLEQELLVI